MSEIPELEPPASHGVRAALGWLDLGNVQEAANELRALPDTLADHPQVLEVWWLIHVQASCWTQALEVAERQMVHHPRSPSSWLHRAYAVRRIPGGGLQAAWEALLPAAGMFPNEPIIPFNLACYACQLGHLDRAREWLAVARRVGGADPIRDLACADPDLQPLWPELKAAGRSGPGRRPPADIG